MQELLPGFLAALSLSASLLLVPTLLTQVGAPFMGIYTASMLMAFAGTLAFGRLGLPVAAAPGAALTSWLVAIVMLAHGVSWQMVLFMGAVVSLVMTAALAFTAFSKRPGRLAGLVQLFPPCIADGLQGAVGLMLLVQGLYQGHLLMGSPTGPVQLGNMADPVAYISLVGIIAMLSLMAVGARWAVLGGVLTSAVLAFAGGFWVLPDAPFFLPEGLDRTGLQLIFMNGWENVKVCDYADLSLVLALFLILSGWGGLKALAPHLDDGQMGRSLLSLSGLSFIACLLGTMPLTAAPESAAGQAMGGRTGRMAYWTAAFLALLLFMEPTLQSMASFPSIFAPAFAGAGLVLLLRMKPVFSGGLADKVAAGLLFLILPLAQDVAAGLGAACIAYVSLTLLSGGHVSRFLRVLAVAFLLYFFYGFWSIL